MFDIWHLGLPVEDLERSVKFYVDGLGFELLGYAESDRYRMAFARVPGGAFTIELLEYHEKPSAPKRPDHLAFEAADLSAYREGLVRSGFFAGLPPVAPAGAGLRRFELKDPDGVVLQFYEGRAVFDRSIASTIDRKEAYHV